MHRWKKRTSAMLYTMALVVTGFLSFLLSGCGGGGGGSSSSGAQFTIVSGNWGIPLPGGASANGSLIQSGSTLSGTLHVIGSTCFDPVLDTLMVSGTASHDGSFTLAFSTAPLRGQVIAVSGSADGGFLPNLSGPPTSPQPIFFATISINGGACAGQVSGKPQLYNMSGNPIFTDLGTPAGSADFWSASARGILTQSGPDASGIFQVAGNFAITGSHCFTTGTITSSSVQGPFVQMTVNTDSGQLVGSGIFSQILDGLGFVKVGLTFTVQGGTCNGETVLALIHVM